MNESSISSESAVRERYAKAAREKEVQLCCPVDYDATYLKVIPQEVIEKDYGCGDPSRYLKPGETVLDLGSGAGKICFIAAQVVGSKGRVIGVDMTDEMLEVARRSAPIVAEKIGYNNVEFLKGRIQDLALPLDPIASELEAHPIESLERLFVMESRMHKLRQEAPLIESGSIDVVVSNCVLNLVEQQAKKQLFLEIYRVLKEGGRAVVSDIVSSEPVPQKLQDDPELWSGCISGALTKDDFIHAFVEAGFSSVSVLKADDEQPWQTVEGIDFYSITVEALKGEGRNHMTLEETSSCCGGSKCT